MLAGNCGVSAGVDLLKTTLSEASISVKASSSLHRSCLKLEAYAISGVLFLAVLVYCTVDVTSSYPVGLTAE